LGQQPPWPQPAALTTLSPPLASPIDADAFEEFVNLDSRCASFLACYIDDQLKSGLRGVTEEDAEQQLERVIVIFRFLADKDVFENFYRNHLAKRLLASKSVSDEIEKIMIAKLKLTCGSTCGATSRPALSPPPIPSPPHSVQQHTTTQNECGQQFTSKMEGMFVDMKLSTEIMDDFRASPQFAALPVELDIQVRCAVRCVACYM
jgi:cullin 3